MSEVFSHPTSKGWDEAMIVRIGKNNATVRFSFGYGYLEKKYKIKNVLSIALVSGMLICKFCSELAPVKNGYYVRYVKTLNGEVAVIVINYKCWRCGETMTPELPMVNPYKRYGKDVQRIAVGNHVEKSSLRETQSRLENDWNIHIARSATWYWVQKLSNKSVEVFECDIRPKLNRCKTIELDELYVNVAGTTGGILNAIDADTWINFHSSLHLDVNMDKAREAFRYLSRMGINPDIVVTDDNKIYHSMWKYFGAEHLLCEFHLMRTVSRTWKEYERAESKRRQEQLLENIIKNCKTFFSQRKFGEKYTTTNDIERLQRFQRKLDSL
jgi:arsenate reductase-like glutaredoxin family protein